MLWNCNHLNKDKLSQLQDLISPRLSLLSSLPAVMALCEIHLKPSKTPLPNLPKLLGYTFVTSSSINTPGCGFFVHSSIPHRLQPPSLLRPPDTDLAVMDVCWVQLRLPSYHRDLLFACVYFNTNSPFFDPDRHWDILRDCLESGCQTGKDIIVLGDFNSQHIELGATHSNPNGTKLLTLTRQLQLSSLNYIHTPNQITRPSTSASSSTTGTTIDLVFTSNPLVVQQMNIGNNDTQLSIHNTNDHLISDHLPIWVHFTQAANNISADNGNSAAPRWKCLQAKEEDWTDYKETLEHRLQRVKDIITLPLVNASSPHVDEALSLVTESWNILRDEIIAAASVTIGRQGSTSGVSKHQDSYWRQPGVREAAAQLKASRRQFNHRPHCPASKQAFREAKCTWKKTKADAQKKQWETTCQAIRRNNKDGAAMWRQFNNTVPKEFVPLINVLSTSTSASSSSVSSSSNAPSPSVSLPSLPSSLTSGLEATAQYFASVCSEHKALPLHPDHQHIQEQVLQHIQQATNSASLFDDPITPTDVKQVCKYLSNPCKATGPDEVHPKLLASACDILYEILACIMSFSLQYSAIPQEWKQANVTALYKGKGADKTEAGSYRPVSVTCAVARVMERILFQRIVNVIDPQLSSSQSGFRKGRSCYDNLLRITLAIQSAMAAPRHLPAIFLDLSKAFDSVWHEGLLHKLWKKNIDANIWLWIRSFLMQRQLRVVQTGSVSSWYEISAGVPQGSVLAPLLFLVFIDDLTAALTEVKVEVALLADDVVIWPDIQNTRNWKQRYEALQLAMDQCGEWCIRWKMKWNINKSNIVYFCKKSNHASIYKKEYNITLHGVALSPAPSYTYLGLTLQHNGKWNEHFKKLKSRASISSHMITRVNQRHTGPSPVIIRQLVMAMPRATILWALPFWDPTPSQFDVLNRYIVTPLRTSLALPLCTSRAAVLAEFGTADIQGSREQQILAYASRLNECDIGDHLGKQLFERHKQLLHNRRYTPSPFWSELQEIEDKWGCSASRSSSCQLKQTMVQRHLKRYHESTPSTHPPRPGLRQIKLQPGASHYLYHDSKNAAVLRARLRFDINGLQLGVVGTRVAHAAATKGLQSDQDCRCQLCIKDNADSRKHLITECPTLLNHRSDLEFELTTEANEIADNSSRMLRVASYHCDPGDSQLRFILGELNCIKSDHALPNPPASSRPPLRRSMHPDIREKILPTTCQCSYPSLSIKHRLQTSATFLQHLFATRFPGTVTNAVVVSSA